MVAVQGGAAAAAAGEGGGQAGVAGVRFDYLASAMGVPGGGIRVVGMLVADAVAGGLYPPSQFAFWALGALALPWLLVKALAFNARNSGYRGLRFDFRATPRQVARVYLVRLVVVVLTAGLALPWFVARHKAFVASHHAFGTSGFHCELPARSFYGIYLLALLIALAFAVPGVAASGYLTYQQMRGNIALPQSLAWLLGVVPLVPIYVGYALPYPHRPARTANLFWGRVQGEGGPLLPPPPPSTLFQLYF